MRAVGSRLNINMADAEMLHQFFTALGLPDRRVDSLTDALLDWRDPDDLPRPAGAEREWYERQGRSPPRNAPLASGRELARVRGFETLAMIDSLVDIEPGRLDLNRAPLPVLAALPGFTSEALASLAELRARSSPVADLLTFSATLSPAARTALVARYADLVRLTTTEPDAWLLISRARVGTPPITAVIEVRIVRAGARAAIVRRRTWVE
jgi:type II secretory pathway component PulK